MPFTIALTLFRYFPFGGMQRDMLATARLCQARGHNVRILCHTWQGEQPSDFEVTLLDANGKSNHSRAHSFAASFSEWHRSNRTDVVLGFDKMPGLDLYFAADPCFITRTATRAWPYRWTRRYRTFRELEGSVFDQAATTRILLLNPHERANYQTTWGTAAERFELLPIGIARDRRAGQDAVALRQQGRKEFALQDDERLVLLLGANFELKGLDRAMRAVQALPTHLAQRTRLLAVGQPAPSRLRKLANALGLEERVILQPGRDDIPRLLQAADLLVHPARRDTTGTVLLEAIAAGLPVICSGACGYAHHIESANCGKMLSEPFAQRELDEVLRSLLSRDLSIERESALAYANEHELHAMHDAIVDHIEAIATAPRQQG